MAAGERDSNDQETSLSSAALRLATAHLSLLSRA
jgi:hypothetical protein